MIELVAWIPTAVISALAFVVWKKLDSFDTQLKDLTKVFQIELKSVQLDLRALDVRVSRMEIYDSIQERAVAAASVLATATAAAAAAAAAEATRHPK